MARDRTAPLVAIRDRDDTLLLRSAHRHAIFAERALQWTLSMRDCRALSRLVGRARGRNAQRARTRASRGATGRAGEARPRTLCQNFVRCRGRRSRAAAWQLPG